MYNKNNIKETLSVPEKPLNLPPSSQWLSGEGAGSWFSLEKIDKKYFMRRYSPDGNLECSGFFKVLNDSIFDITKPYRLTYLSHCSKLTVVQDSKTIEFRTDNKS